MNEVYLEPTETAAAALFAKNISGEVVMLNMLRLREVADYSAHPELAMEQPISGKQALRKYIVHTLPFLQASGGDMLFLGDSGPFFIGPADEHWDVIMLIRQNSLADFLGFASNQEYLAGIGHRTAAVEDSRLLPAFPAEP